MKTRPTLLVLIAVVGLLPAVTRIAQTSKANQTLNPAYLGGMPTVERVMRDVKGNDSIDTAARQAGAFWQLRRAIYDMALSQHRSDRQATSDENRLTQAYYAAHNNVWEPIGKALAQDRPRLFKLQGYATDPGFLKELLEQLCTPAFRTEYFRAMADLDARVQARKDADTIRVNPSTGGTQAGKNEQPGAQPGIDGVVRALSDLINKSVAQQTSQTTTGQRSPADVQASTDEAKKGDAHLKAKDYSQAIEHFNKSIAIAPSSGAYAGLGSAYDGLKQYPKAIEAYQQVIRMVPSNPQVHLWLSMSYQQLGKQIFSGSAASTDLKPFENAEAEAREAIRLKPDYHDAYYALGGSTFVQNKYVEALAAFQQAIRLKPDDQESLYLLGITYARLGKKEESMQVVQRLAALNKEYAQELLTTMSKQAAASPPTNATPGTAGFYFNEGQKYHNAKDFTKAVESFQKAIHLKPDVPTLANTYAWLAASYRELKQYANAIAAAKESLRLRPNYADTTFGLGWSYYLAGQHQNALAMLNESVRLNPKDAETQYWIGEVYFFGMKQPEKALTAYRESLRLRPNDARTINQTGLVYSELEQFPEAVNAFKEVIRLKPDEGLYHSNLGLTYVQMGMKEQAIAVQQTLQKIDGAKAKALDEQINATFSNKDDPDNLFAYASVMDSMGHPQAALPVYRRVLLLKPEPETIAVTYSDMGDVYKELKKMPQATAAYQQALVLYQRLIRAKPQEAFLQYGLGHTYLGLDQKEQAMQVYRKLATLDKKYARELLEEINKSNSVK